MYICIEDSTTGKVLFKNLKEAEMDGSCQFLSKNRDGLCAAGLAACSALIIQYGNEAILAHVSALWSKRDEIEYYAKQLKGTQGLRITIARCLNAYNEESEETFKAEQEQGDNNDAFRKCFEDDGYEMEAPIINHLMWNKNAQGDGQALGDNHHDFSGFLGDKDYEPRTPIREFQYQAQDERQAFGESDDGFRDFFEDVFGITPEFLLLEHDCLVVTPDNKIHTFSEYPFQKGEDTITWIEQKTHFTPTFFQDGKYNEEDGYDKPPSPSSVFFLST